MRPPRVLIAGIGNIFLGDDGFGVEVAQRLANRGFGPGVRVADFGIRGLDLAFALSDGYDAAILLDASPRGGQPGTVYVMKLDPTTSRDESVMPAVEPHGMDPRRVLRLAASLGGAPRELFLVGCEPTPFDADDPPPGLTPPVRAALDQAVEAVAKLVHQILTPPAQPSVAGSVQET